MERDDDHSHPITLGQPPQSGGGGEQQLVAEVHRMWIVAATAKICREAGPDAVRLRYVAQRAGVTMATAEHLMGTAESCLTSAFSKAAAIAAQCVIPRFAAEADPVERVRVGATQLLGFAEGEPELTAVLLCRSEATRGREQRMAIGISRIIADAFDGLEANLPDTRIAVDEALGLVRGSLSESGPDSLLELLPKIVELLLTPQLGGIAAKLHAQRPGPIFAEPFPPGASMPAPSLEIRLTASLLSELGRAPSAGQPSWD